MYNRYSYVGNNPINFVDPSGNEVNAPYGNPQDPSIMFYVNRSTYYELYGAPDDNIAIADPDADYYAPVEQMEGITVYGRTSDGRISDGELGTISSSLGNPWSDRLHSLKANATLNHAGVAVLFAARMSAVYSPEPSTKLTGVAVLTGAATVGYLASQVDWESLANKMEREISRLRERVRAKRGYVYSLRALQEGIYVCYTCEGGLKYLRVGDVWKC